MRRVGAPDEGFWGLVVLLDEAVDGKCYIPEHCIDARRLASGHSRSHPGVHAAVKAAIDSFDGKGFAGAT